MPTVEKLSIALPPDMVSMIKAAVASGEYASTSEIIREALRGWKFKRKLETLEHEELRQLIQDGIDSGPSSSAQVVFSKLRAKHAKMEGSDDL